MKHILDVGFRCVAATVIASLVAGCAGGSSAGSALPPSAAQSVPVSVPQPAVRGQIKAQSTGIAAFVIPAVNGAQYNVAQWSSIEYPASHSALFVGTDTYNNVVYSFTVTTDPTSGYFQFSTSDGMYAVRATTNAPTYTVSKGTNPNRDMNLLTMLKFDMTDAELGGGGGGGRPGGPAPALAGVRQVAAVVAQSSRQVDALVKGLVVVGGALALGGLILALPALAVGSAAAVTALTLAGAATALLAAAVDYANTVAGPDEGNGSVPNVDPPSSNGPPSIADFCTPTTYEGQPALACTFYF